MAISTGITIEIDSRRTGTTYRVVRFTEYNVDLDLETDADAFDFVLKNPNGVYSGIFSKFDNCRVSVNDHIIMNGTIDRVVYICGDDSYIRISGRDGCAPLIDNDALPDTLLNVQPKTYIEGKCAEYGIKSSVATADIYEKLVIGCNESEISIFNNILLDSRQRIWFLVDTLYTGNWATDASPSHAFSDNPSNGIPIKTLELSEDGTDMKSQVVIYGSNGSGSYELVGSSENSYMTNMKIRKRKTNREYSNNASSKYKSIADKDIRDLFRNNIELKIDVRIDKGDYFIPNTTAQIIYSKLGINSTFFVRRVQYSKSIDSGSVASLVMIPADTTFETIWQNSNNSVTTVNQASTKIPTVVLTNKPKSPSDPIWDIVGD